MRIVINSIGEKRIMITIILCICACAFQGFAQDFAEIKTLNAQVYTWIKTVVTLGGFIWILIEVILAWTQGRIGQAATWYKLLGIIAGILIIGGGLLTLFKAIFTTNPIGA
jgi:hypothetical protein